MDYLTIALPKGKLFIPAVKMLTELGYTATGLREDSRKLVIANDEMKIRFIITKTVDLPTYVEYGTAITMRQ
jgi:ATP phosphoribosyltransferase